MKKRGFIWGGVEVDVMREKQMKMIFVLLKIHFLVNFSVAFLLFWHGDLLYNIQDLTSDIKQVQLFFGWMLFFIILIGRYTTKIYD